MKKQMKTFCFHLLFTVMFMAVPLRSQVASASDSVETAVTFKVFTSQTQVPVNRQIELTCQLSTMGELNIEIGKIQDPVLTQLKIVGVTSSNKVIGTPSGRKAVKEIGYILKPEMEGMGYIEPVAISYVDKATGKTHYLTAQRLSVEILPAVKDKDAQSKLWIWIVGLVVLMSIGLFLVLQSRNKLKKEEEEPDQILEERYLAELKEGVSPEGPDFQNSFSTLSKMMRRYLADKYDVSALELTTEDLIRQLKGIDSLSNIVEKLETIFKQTDIIKFSGQKTTAAELGQAYTVFESLLETNLKIETERQNQIQPKKKRFGRS